MANTDEDLHEEDERDFEDDLVDQDEPDPLVDEEDDQDDAGDDAGDDTDLDGGLDPDDDDEDERPKPKEERKNSAEKRIAKITGQWRGEQRSHAKTRETLDVANGHLRTAAQTNLALRKQLLDFRQKEAKSRLRQARDEGDDDAEIEAQRAIHALDRESEILQRAEVELREAPKRAPKKQEAEPEPDTEDDEPAPRRQRLSGDAQDKLKRNQARWLKQNPWAKDAENEDAIGFAATVDQQLTRQGWDPTDYEYFEELDRRVAKRFPEHFEDRDLDGGEDDREEVPTPRRKKKPGAPPVAPVSRSGPSSRGSRRGVTKLTAEQREVADMLGVPYHRYAARIKDE
ncbi:MAG: hypothetical protein NXI16_01285 [Alphaproteobacteria bacterium]|nr:hypothetical protein [Alphaproteobacteria bacterium]